MEDSKWISHFKKHWKKGVYVLLIIACIGIWSERFYKRSHTKSSKDYIVMRQLFERFKQGQLASAESLELAEKAVKRHPELHPSYDGMLTQAFFSVSDPAHAAIYAEKAQKRIAPIVHSHYSTFAKATTWIASGKLEDAYALATKLEASLEEDESDFIQLRGFNLLRLLFLAKALGQPTDVWNQRLHAHPSFETISSLFSQGDLTLDRYLENELT